MTVEIVKPGLLTTLQDSGRSGYVHLGVGRSGAFDAPALRIANALCRNPRDACALEITLVGPTLRFHDDAWIAVCGAPIPLHVDGARRSQWAPVLAPAGATVTLGSIQAGCRSYLTVRGGFDVASVLGSRSTDVNARLGPFDGRPLRTGDVLPAMASRPPAATRTAPGWWIDPRPWFSDNQELPLRLVWGSHLDRLAQVSHNLLFSEPFKVLADSNRVGLRLAGPTLEWTAPIEMVSEGCVPGLLQLPPSGQPIAFGPECPVSGGYPRVGQIAAVDLPRLAQCRPGDAVRFTPCTLDDALDALEKRERALIRLETAIRKRLETTSRP